MFSAIRRLFGCKSASVQSAQPTPYIIVRVPATQKWYEVPDNVNLLIHQGGSGSTVIHPGDSPNRNLPLRIAIRSRGGVLLETPSLDRDNYSKLLQGPNTYELLAGPDTGIELLSITPNQL